MRARAFEISLVGNAQEFVLSLVSLLRAAGSEGEVLKAALNGNVLDALYIDHATQGKTGVLQLGTSASEPCYFAIDGDKLTISLSALTQGLHIIKVRAAYGTEKRVICSLYIHVTEEVAYENDPISIELAVVSTIGDRTAGLVVDQEVIEGSENPVSGGAVYTAIQEIISTYAEVLEQIIGVPENEPTNEEE